MRSLGALTALLLLTLVPIAAGHPGHHGPGPMMLYGNLVDAAQKRFELSPFPGPTTAVKVDACDADAAASASGAGCDHVTYPLRNVTSRDLDIGSEAVKVTFWLTSDAGSAARALGVPNAPSHAALQPLGVEARLVVAGKVVASDAKERTVPGTASGKPDRFDFSLLSTHLVLPAGAPVELQVHWWQWENDGKRDATGFFTLHAGREHGTRIEFPFRADPLMVQYWPEQVDLDALCAKGSKQTAKYSDTALVKQACGRVSGHAVVLQTNVVPTFRNASERPVAVSMQPRGPDPVRTLVGPFNATGADGTRHFVYVWGYGADRAEPSRYQVFVLVESSAITDGHSEAMMSLSTVKPLAAGSSPAAGSLPILAVVGLAATIFRLRRRPD